MEKKYILTERAIELFGHTLYRIQAIKDFAGVSAGMFGGYIEREDNLDHAGNAWVADNAMVAGNARVADNAIVAGNAMVADTARVAGNAMVADNAMVAGNAWVAGDAILSGDAAVHEPSDIALVKGFGSKFRTTSFFRCADGRVRCQCGCFYGTIDDFRVIVSETHGDSKYAKEYLMIADLMELHFKED